MPTPPPKLYKRFFIDNNDERVGLFRTVAHRFNVATALYAGSFVQIGPSFVVPRVVYVDNDRRTGRFFADPALLDYVNERKEYAEEPEIAFNHCSYESDFAEEPESFDLLISLYAGFISAACKQYLKIGGVLLVNDSHGDASMANLDPNFELIAAVNRRGESFSLKESQLHEYFVPKREINLTPDLLRERGRGVGFVKPAFGYIFRRVA